jgi:hypothetical protein
LFGFFGWQDRQVTSAVVLNPNVAANNSSDQKRLRLVSFAAHAARGLILDQLTRRRTMFLLVLTALVLLFLGSTVLQTALNPHEHLGWFIFFWVVCGWVTLTAMLLAIFDLLMVRLESRRTQRSLREVVTPPSSTTDK